MNAIRSIIALRLPLLFAMLALSSLAHADGPGIGNLAYTPAEVGNMITRIDATDGAPEGHGFVTMHRGYLIVPFSFDGGGGNGTGGFAIYDVSDPRNPVNTFTTENNTTYTSPASPHYAGDLREPHGYSAWGDIFCFATNRGQGTGLEFWDFSNIDPPTPRPMKIGKIVLPLSGGDYSPTPWWVFWQGGRYVYVAGTSGGLFIVDAADPINPLLVRQISNADLGGFRINTVFAIGNLMVIAMSDGNGLATLDISDPANPVVLDTAPNGQNAVGYSMMINGDKVLGANDPARIWSIADPTDIQLVATGPNVSDKGGYGTFQDGFFHYGSSFHYVKLNLQTTPTTVTLMAAPPGFSAPDWDFANALGNLTYMGNDHGGNAIVVHQAQPDLTPPVVTMVSPKHLSTDQTTMTRVGLTFSDQLDASSISILTLIVRPVGGQPLAGRYTHQTGIVNFWPDAPLEEGRIYEVFVPAGGIRDLVGNVITQPFTSRFSTTGSEPLPNVSIVPDPLIPALVNEPVHFDAAIEPAAPDIEFQWNFGDGTPETGFWDSAAATHAFSAPGHYPVRVTIRDTVGGPTNSDTAVQTVHRPLAPVRPTNSSTIIYDSTLGSNRIWCVNPDNNSISVFDALTLAKIGEIATGTNPRTLARAPDGTIWVVNQDSDSISVVHPNTLSVVANILLRYGAKPYGIAFDPTGGPAYVSLESGRELLKINNSTREVQASLPLGFPARGIAVAREGSANRIFVTRFISPDTSGEIAEIEDLGNSLELARTVNLSIDAGPDREDAGRGVPNYISSVVVSPDLANAWIPSKKDNIQRGLSRDGNPLDFESTVRTIISQINLASNQESLSRRIDFNDGDMASAAIFSPLGDYIFVALQGDNSVRVIDAYSNQLVASVEQTGLAPQGLAMDPIGQRLYVHNFMSRSIRSYNIAELTASVDFNMPLVATALTVETERLPANVLAGKQLFYNAADTRMNRDRYLSCASCHLDGGQDGRVWDFTNRGEGLRNTTSLRGARGIMNGPVHWSANFDEIQDFENDIRHHFGGTGFMPDTLFHSGTTSDTLGDRKVGKSPQLGALASYLASLNTVGRSPHRSPDGTLTPSGFAGKIVFNQLRCFECHGGPNFTDSPLGLTHDVDTITALSGKGRNFTLQGIDTPTLRGLWDTAPYLHTGGAPLLDQVLSQAHGGSGSLSQQQRADLVQYLLQIDENEPGVAPFERVRITSPAGESFFNAGSTINLVAQAAPSVEHVRFVLKNDFDDALVIGTDLNPLDGWSFDWQNVPAGVYTIVARATDANGAISTSRAITIADTSHRENSADDRWMIYR